MILAVSTGHMDKGIMAEVVDAALASPTSRLIQGKQCCDDIRQAGSSVKKTEETYSREECNGG